MKCFLFFLSIAFSCPLSIFKLLVTSYPFFERFYLFIFRERARGKERTEEKHWCKDEHGWVTSPTCPNLGLNLQPRPVPRPGITSSLLLCETMPNQLSHTVQGTSYCYIKEITTFSVICNIKLLFQLVTCPLII